MAYLYDQAGHLIRQIYDQRIDGPPVLDLARHFPAGARFTAAWRAIRDEAQAIAGHLEEVPRFHEIMREQAAISANDDRDWRLFILKAYGVENRHNLAACPVLAGLVASAPEVVSASISFLAPGKHIPPHRGPFRGILRFYLGLTMPRAADGRPAAVLKIDGTEYRVAEGEALLWDDTYTHEVWNGADRVRAVLLLDVWRGGMPIDMELFSRLLMAMVRVAILVRGV